MPDATPSTPVSVGLLDDMLTIEGLATALRCTERTIRNWKPPSIRLGGRVLYHVPTVRQWIMDQQEPTRTEPKRGRPTKRAA